MKTLLKHLQIAFLLSAVILGAFMLRTASAQTFENKGDWGAFKRNRSILGLTAGETPMKNVFAILGNARLSQPKDQHDFSVVCFKSQDEKVFIVFKTGYLHDNKTLYAFALSTKRPEVKACVASDYIKGRLQTADGIGLQSSKASVLENLGKPSSEKQKELQWEYQYYEKYSEPKIGYAEAGPTGARYRLKGTVKGAYHYASIVARFVNNKVTEFDVTTGKEDDGSLEGLPLDK
jgi:hypothetical protein